MKNAKYLFIRLLDYLKSRACAAGDPVFTSQPQRRPVKTPTLVVYKQLFQKALVGMLLLILASACHSEYHQRVEAELATGVREDSLFLGITFGMSPKDFFSHCWELNKQGIIQEGTQNISVMHEVTELKHPATMNFYPAFYEDAIYEMPVTYAYKAWAPWNKELFSDSLQQDVLALYQQQYGDDFLTVDHPKGVAYVKVDGNRRISILKENDTNVKVLFTDLLAERKKKEQPNQANL